VDTLIAVIGAIWIVMEIVIAVRPAPARGAVRDRYSRIAIAAAIFAGVVAWQWLARRHSAPIPGGAGLWQTIALTILSAVGIVRRIQVEEGVLLDSLGTPYRDYMRRTRRLIPGVF
jgi:hypothetical protein